MTSTRSSTPSADWAAFCSAVRKGLLRSVYTGFRHGLIAGGCVGLVTSTIACVDGGICLGVVCGVVGGIKAGFVAGGACSVVEAIRDLLSDGVRNGSHNGRRWRMHSYVVLVGSLIVGGVAGGVAGFVSSSCSSGLGSVLGSMSTLWLFPRSPSSQGATGPGYSVLQLVNISRITFGNCIKLWFCPQNPHLHCSSGESADVKLIDVLHIAVLGALIQTALSKHILKEDHPADTCDTRLKGEQSIKNEREEMRELNDRLNKLFRKLHSFQNLSNDHPQSCQREIDRLQQENETIKEKHRQTVQDVTELHQNLQQCYNKHFTGLSSQNMSTTTRSRQQVPEATTTSLRPEINNYRKILDREEKRLEETYNN